MKKTAKILIALLMVTLFTCVFTACDLFGGTTPDQPTELPSIIGGETTDSDDTDTSGDQVVSSKPAYLTFSYLKQAPSVFKHIYIEEFDLADIEYHVTYQETLESGDVRYVAEDGEPLSMDMLSRESKNILETFGDDEISGHYMIFVSKEVEYVDEEGTTRVKKVEGSFGLHLKTKACVDEFVDITIDINGGYALFGDFDPQEGTSKVKVEKGYSWTWAEFLSDFPAYKEGHAITNITVDGKTYSASSSDAIKINENSVVTLGWSENILPVTFDINLPDGVTEWAPKDSSLLENYDANTGTWSVSVVKGEGVVPRPSVSNIATLEGYTFAGWRTADGTVWNFNKSVGSAPVTLYALWTIRTYSVKYILMGGELDLAKGYSNTAITNLTRTDVDVQYAVGLGPDDPDYDPESMRDILAFKPIVVTFSGIPYGAKLSDYYAVCNVRSDSTDIISISADPTIFQSQLTKNGDCYEVEGWYFDSFFEDSNLFNQTTVTDDVVLYPKWMLKDNLTAEEENAYFAEKLFKYTKKSDGTLRIDVIQDLSVSELKIPASVNIDGVDYVISEIGENAIINIKTLISVDLSQATSLTRIGKQAFAYCPNLREIKVPEGGLNVTYVGEDAFRGTEYINSYADREGRDFAVLGNVLVKYVGDINETEINIDTMSVPYLSEVDTIAPGAFSGLMALESVTIGSGIEQIFDRAFYGDSNLLTVNGGADLSFVAADAFDGTKYISTVPANGEYLRIGNIYYRYVGAGTSATIPAGVKYIAPNAFMKGSMVETIVFENADDIIYVGAEAFASTKWMSADHTATETGDDDTFVQDGFVVINGILVAKRGRQTVVELPQSVRVIASDAFSNAYITNITVPADTNLELIEAYAFNGANNLRALTFIDSTDSVFVEFNEGAFSRKSGEAVGEGFTIYLYEDPINTLQSAVSGSDTIAIKSWKELYQGASNMFKVLVTESIEFNSEVGIPTAYLYDGTTVDFVSVWDSLGLLNSTQTHLVDGIIVVRSDGIARTEDIDLAELKSVVGGVEVALDGSIGDKAFTLTIDGITPENLAYSVYPAIKENTMKVYHLVGENEVEGLPTFYTTQPNFNEAEHVIKIKFTYNDGLNTQGEILISDEKVSVSGYRHNIGANKELQIYVDYYGLEVYTVYATYTVKHPTNASIEQCDPMTLSVNASKTEVNRIASKVAFKLTLSDGTYKYVGVDSNAKFISLADAKAQKADAVEINLNTATLGHHMVGLCYGEPGSYVYTQVLYSVILSTDGSRFTYSIVNGGAVITGIKSGYDSTVAIPAKVTLDANGNFNADSTAEYEVVAIGDGAFKDKTDLEYVYVPATVKSIGNSAFEGCTSLKQVRSFAVAEVADSGLTEADVTLVDQQARFIGSVTITGLVSTGRATIKVPATVTYNKVVDGEGVQIDATYELDVVLSADLFADYNGEISLPDTDYFRAYAQENLAGKNVTFHDGNSGDRLNTFVTDDPVVTYAYYTGNAIINAGVEYIIENNTLAIPERIVRAVDATDETFGYEYNYTLVGVADQAFARAFEQGMRTIYLPTSIREFQGALADVFGYDNYEYVVQHVYDVTVDAIYTPTNAFPNVETIGKKALYGCVSLNGVDFTLAKDLKSIGNYAFYGCSDMEEINLSKTQITSIEASTFSGCSSLRIVQLPATVTEIGDLAFNGCSSLESVEGMVNVTYIGTLVFNNCSSLQTINLPATLTFSDGDYRAVGTEDITYGGEVYQTIKYARA